MDEPSKPVLDYAKPSRFTLSLSRRGFIKLCVFAAALLLVIGFICGPTSGQIRLDTGDLRYCWFGIPLRYDRMPEPERSQLLALSARSPRIRSRWVTCVTYPHGGSNNPELSFRMMFVGAGIWAGQDPQIARWLLEDVQFCIRHGAWESPEANGMMGGLFTTDYVTGSVETDWRADPTVMEYCRIHGYTPPPPATSTATKLGE